jgi:hypothetical protein
VLKAGKPLSKENLDANYVARRRASVQEKSYDSVSRSNGSASPFSAMR